MPQIIARSSIVSLVMLHVCFIIGELAASVGGEDAARYQETDRRICAFPNPPDWCLVAEVGRGTIFEDFESVAGDINNIGALDLITGLGWGLIQLVFKLTFFQYSILDAHGPMGLIGTVLRWIGLVGLAAAVGSIAIGVLTRR